MTPRPACNNLGEGESSRPCASASSVVGSRATACASTASVRRRRVARARPRPSRPAPRPPSCDPAAVARALEGSELGVDGGARACGERDADRVEVGVVLASLPERVGGLAQGGLAELPPRRAGTATPRARAPRASSSARSGTRATDPESLELPAAQRRASDELRVARRPSGVRPQSVGGCTGAPAWTRSGASSPASSPRSTSASASSSSRRGRGIARGRVDAWREACSSAIRRGRSPCGR
ncbi:hypothetical protein G6O69_38870 [Pseudenhygromyxa sp. WMMC2535]|uniref:hypothetical protein n=1 Tax=Pseudenhygromyxa sp. WMMC2535 TaxID=2712867 RepID=UPI00159580B8|nr:hypothetical protein [Pseudenhygromyxa sp. WMMC2535]NVB43822.1 hypothetical protein [Pseudenhygromyxa sp. WMMC2535]